MMSAGTLLRRARARAGLTQQELADRAGVAQSVISVYESDRRQPSLSTLAAMIEAAGFALDVRLAGAPAELANLTGPIGQRLAAQRVALRSVAAKHGVHVIGVFGSVARGQERPDSDVDLLVELPTGMGLLGLGRFRQAAEALLHAPVDVIPESDLKPGVVDNVRADLVRL